ncbi:MAG: hypothetical protein M1832_002052 [Thelocarpon impressellum]|nr:MAG: hypothetical protein M1832_002052 [Thelocarpon impressellum]
MAEDDGPGTSNSTAANVLTGLGEDDIQVNVYEGGLKSWECSVDLVKVLLRDDIYSSRLFGAGAKHIVELGAGTALPTMALFQLAVTRQAQSTRFTVSDYNFDVLRLVSIPNILLSWAIAASEGHWQAESDLEITSELLERFQTDLRRRDITVDAISGAWGSPFIDALTDRPDPATRLVVASETIYSPASLDSFAEVLLGALGGAEDYTALVAAKRVYFGVGGGVAEFVRALESRGGAARQVAEEAAQGVSRVVLEIAAGRQLTRRRQEGL